MNLFVLMYYGDGEEDTFCCGVTDNRDEAQRWEDRGKGYVADHHELHVILEPKV